MLREFDNRAAASDAAARFIAEALNRRLESKPEKASLVVSGGTTPGACFARLAQLPLNWARVQVTLTDERHVPDSAPESNERLVREQLIHGLAAAAEFIPLSSGCQRVLVRPLACSLIGIGEDGHFASLFPDLANLSACLDPTEPSRLVEVETRASPLARTSMNLAGLLDSDALLVLAFGEKKREILSNPTGYPVDALLTHGRPRLQIIWAP